LRVSDTVVFTSVCIAAIAHFAGKHARCRAGISEGNTAARFIVVSAMEVLNGLR
jgi:hypothetical protein